MCNNTACLTFKTKIPKKFHPNLEELHKKSSLCVKRMIKDRSKSSTKYYKDIPSVVAKGLINKYQRNKKCKSVKRLVLSICGDKGTRVKMESNGIKVPSIFRKETILAKFPKPIVGYIRQVEFFKKNKIWYMSYSYNTPKEEEIVPKSYLGVDRNSVGNVVAVANIDTGKVLKLGPDCSKITENFRNRRRKLQKKGAKNALAKIRNKQSNRIKDINHKVSRAVVDYAKLHRSAIVLENLKGISKKGKAKRYVQKSQWSFYQLETYIKYKAALLGIPVYYVDPAYTSQKCSRCGSINKPVGKQYKCSKCGHFDHRDANAAFNISKYGGDQAVIDRDVTVRNIGSSLNQKVDKAI